MPKHCTDAELEQLWTEFADTPINDQDEIEEDFHLWKIGTNRFEIWEWFDEEHSKGVAYLMNGGINAL